MRKLLLIIFSSMASAQFAMVAPTSTSTDVFVMGGSDFVRPGLLPRVNLNIGMGHTFDFLHKDPFGDEIVISYTYENGGSHGFFHTKYGSHTENIGLMKNFNIPCVDRLMKKKVSFYTEPMAGITSMTGNKHIENRLYLGAAGGIAIHFSGHTSIWVQEMWNKVAGFPGYPTSSIGFVLSL